MFEDAKRVRFAHRMEAFGETVGHVLRRARIRGGLTLQGVAAQSGGRFKPSAVGGYERGERAITLERFCDLAAIYGEPGDRLLSEVLEELNPDARREIVVDLNRMALLDKTSGRLLMEFVQRVRGKRGDYLSDVVTLRAGDLEALSLLSGTSPDALLTKLKRVLRSPEPTART